MYYITNQMDEIIAVDTALLSLLGAEDLRDLSKRIILGEIAFRITATDTLALTIHDQVHAYTIAQSSLSSILGPLTLVQLTHDSTPEHTKASATKIKEFNTIEHPAEHPAPTQEQSNNVLDIPSISKTMGVTPREYKEFLSEYIRTALSLEKELQSKESRVRDEAIETLMHLSSLLHLQKLHTILNDLRAAQPPKNEALIEAFFTTLWGYAEELDENALKHSLIDLDLQTIKPQEVAFDLKKTADALSLPEALIEALTRDFIAQSKEAIPKILDAYTKEEHATLEEIIDPLKGAAANLKIHPLHQLLTSIQSSSNRHALESNIKHYWASILSLENQIAHCAPKEGDKDE